MQINLDGNYYTKSKVEDRLKIEIKFEVYRKYNCNSRVPQKPSSTKWEKLQ